MSLRIFFDGDEWVGTKSISVSASNMDATRTFSVEVAEGIGTDEFWQPPGTSVRIETEQGDVVLEGFVNSFEPEFDETDHKITVTGRSASQDSVDSSVDHATGRFENMDAKEIIEAAGAPYGLSVEVEGDVKLKKLQRFQINQGETVHAMALRLAKSCGFGVRGGAGNAFILFRSKDDSIGALAEGIFPVKKMKASLSDDKKHKKHKNKGQMSGHEGRYGKEASQPNATVTDGSVKRNRVRISVVERSSDSQTAQDRADWDARRSGADQTKITCIIYGHYLNGILVEPNKRVAIVSPWLKVSREMLIESVEYKFDDSGSISEMEIVDPAGWGGKSKKGSSGAGSDDAWTTPEYESSSDVPDGAGE
jgi:prophage tail gpP-like protein